jgi:DNA polymerase-3 subunit delta
MPPAGAASNSLVLIHGDDDFAVKQRARQIYQQWCHELGGMDHEIIDAQAANSAEALKAVGRAREALNTLPFFGSGKAVWFQNCNFLGDERTATAQAVTETLAEFADELKKFRWDNVRLLISAGKVDKRRTFYKALEKCGVVEMFTAWSLDDKNWCAEAESWARRGLRAAKSEISEEALAELVNAVGPHREQLANEIEKLSLFVGERSRIDVADVIAVVTRNKQARAFALADAVGDRDLQKVLRTLDEELWEMQFDRKRSEIGLLYGLISKIRTLIFLKEMLRAGWLKPERDFGRFRSQLVRVPTDQLPQDRRFNPLALNPYILFKTAGQAKNYSSDELVRAMGWLLECNQRLVSSGLDEALVLQQTLVKIIRGNRDTLDAAPSGS